MTDSAVPTLRQSFQYVHEHWLAFFGVSAIVLTPCFWHRHIAAADLGSHLYNAWLVELIRRGQAPGLWVAHQWTNVLFDYLLSGLGAVFGLRAAEKMAVSLAVLIFFWGMFALVAAAARRAPWFLAPILAAFAYGFTFEEGFFNYYMALGLAFFGVAILWRGKGWERLMALALAPLVVVAHPLGLLWLVGAGAYVGIAEAGPRRQALVFLAGMASLFAAHYYLWHHFAVDRNEYPIYSLNGGDQLLLFGARYAIPECALGVFALAAWIVDVIGRRREPGFWRSYAIPLELYILVELGVVLLPTGIYITKNTAEIALLSQRLTLVSAALLCCLLGAMRPRKWHLIAALGIAAMFFSFLYQDTGTINRMEAQIERLVATLPPGQRVLATILPLDDWRVTIQHIVDMACIGHCFSYGNYEPGAGVFRVRALPGNPYVMSSYDDAVSMEDGDYTVKAEDLPAYQVYQCSASGTELCIRPLVEGEDNDRLGVHSGDE
ncbi:MAG: hypothetical protein ACLQMT_07895 [Candidatus Acidiferrales bacterium]